MKSEFLIILIIRIIFGTFIFIVGFLLGTMLEKKENRKRVAEILDEVIKEKNKNYNPYLLTGEELKRTEEARIRGEK